MQTRIWRSPSVTVINDLLADYIPEWLEDYFLQIELSDFHSGLRYPMLLEWIKQYPLNFTPECIANVFVNTMSYRKDEFKIGELMNNPVFLKEHIWFIFRYPTEIHRRNSGEWYKGFKEITSINKTDRGTLLRESLLAVNRNFNKVLTGWFANLFLYLQPTEQELITLQDELFSTLTCVQTKPVNNTLGIFKKLVTNGQFRREEFTGYIPQLLAAETKSIVNTTLGIIQQMLKNKTGNQKEIVSALTNVFINKEESLQKKAANLLVQYAAPDEEINASLAVCEENMLSNAKVLLANFLPGNNIKEKTSDKISLVTTEKRIIREDNQISIPETYEDYIFFLNQAVDLPEPYFPDHIFSQLIRWTNNIPESSYIQQESAFRKICKQMDKYETRYTPSLRIVGCLLYDYLLYLNSKYPEQTKKIFTPWQKIREEQINREEEAKDQDYPYKAILTPVAEMDCPAFYNGFREIVLWVKQKIETGDTTPLLSTPTHTPCWIDPVVLIQRVALYQQSGAEPNTMDMQLAIQRCALDDTAKALHLVEKELTGEYKALFRFLLHEDTKPTGNYNHPAWWMTAALTRSPGEHFPEFNHFIYSEVLWEQLSGSYGWEVYLRETTNHKKDPVSYPDIKLNTPPYELRTDKSMFIESFTFSVTQKEEQLEKHCTPLTEYDFCNNAKINLPFLLCCIPNNISPITNIVAKELITYSYWEVPEKTIAPHNGVLLSIIS